MRGVWLCSIKSGKVVVVLAGRFAGKKAIVVKANDEGTDDKKFGHALGESPGFDRYRVLMGVYEHGHRLIS
jgi:ribosomal protein L14E/L6E/L27E